MNGLADCKPELGGENFPKQASNLWFGVCETKNIDLIQLKEKILIFVQNHFIQL